MTFQQLLYKQSCGPVYNIPGVLSFQRKHLHCTNLAEHSTGEVACVAFVSLLSAAAAQAWKAKLGAL
jgi:hypothetical protein